MASLLFNPGQTLATVRSGSICVIAAQLAVGWGQQLPDGSSSFKLRYNHGYTELMKTAISIPDSLFEEADRLAKARGWSRSELYSNAVTAYVNSERFSGVREKLDAVYGNDEEDSAIDPFLADAQARSLPREKW